MRDYIKDKSIYVSNLYYDCNIVDCKCKEAVLSFQGNNYCMEHFIEFIRDDKEKEDIEEFKNKRDRIIIAMKERYGKTAKGNEYLENLFKKEFKKWEE